MCGSQLEEQLRQIVNGLEVCGGELAQKLI